MSQNLQAVQDVLENPVFRPKPRAYLLLKLCTLSRLFSPELFDKYWEKLQSLKKDLPASSLTDYATLQSLSEPGDAVQQKGFVANVISQIKVAAEQSIKEPQVAQQKLKECEQLLKKKWWKSGKAPAWMALINAWTLLDRKYALELLSRIDANARKNLIVEWHEEKAFSAEEWELAQRKIGPFDGIDSIVEQILGGREVQVFLPNALVQKVAGKLRAIIASSDEKIDDDQRNAALDKHMRLVENVSRDDVPNGIALMKALYDRVVKDEALFSGDFMKGFSIAGKVINRWSNLKSHYQAAGQHITDKTPKFLRDYALAQWYAMVGDTAEEIGPAYDEMLRQVKNTMDAETWFFVLLVSRGLPKTAWLLVEKSRHKDKLLPAMQRALICQYPETAREMLPVPDAKSDPIGHFIMLATLDDWLQFLRSSTNNGATSVSASFWTKPTIDDALGTKGRDSLYNYYMKTTTKDEMFKIYLRVNAFQFYNHENLDPYLLAALVHWDDKYPEEVAAVTKRLWKTMLPSDFELQADIIRNSIFERCRNVLAAHPSTLFDFLKWIKGKLVDNAYQFQSGNMLYTLSLKKETLFLFSILAAQQVGKFSAKRCDEILLHAIKAYTAAHDFNEGFVKAAAEIYSSDKGLTAIVEPMDLSDSIKEVWQMGIVEACIPRIAAEMLEVKTSAAA
ncbi:MAG: hypothetical protein ONB27_12205 [candidate division KSB1 bacterium]|nr:hypothetical protein [candidate division KSB1 bacterium]